MSQTIEEQLGSFKKHLWSHSQPMEFAAAVVEELLMEVQRQRTVMKAGLVELDKHWHTVSAGAAGTEYDELLNLMASLESKRNGFYIQYLNVAEYNEFVKRRTDMSAIAKRIEILEEMKANGKEEG